MKPEWDEDWTVKINSYVAVRFIEPGKVVVCVTMEMFRDEEAGKGPG
jgi:hypothetical protein